MANHAYVKTRKPMQPQEITAILHELNTSRFKGLLTITFGEENTFWDVEFSGRRVSCWLNSERSFELRYGIGGWFIFWVECSILNELALRFNGKISDDGISGCWPGDKDAYQSFGDIVSRMTAHIRDEALRKEIISLELLLVPEQFRNVEI